MGSKWKEVDLDKIVTFSQGIQVPVEEQTKFKHGNLGRFLRIVDYTNDAEEPRFISSPSKRYYVNHDDIVMIRYGATAGFVGRGLEGIIANNMFRVIPIKDEYLSKDYLYLFLTSNIVQLIISQNIGAAAMPAINFIISLSIALSSPLCFQNKSVQTVSIL